MARVHRTDMNTVLASVTQVNSYVHAVGMDTHYLLSYQDASLREPTADRQ